MQPAYWSDLRKEVKSFAARNRIKRSMSTSALASVIMSHHNSGPDKGTLSPLSVSMTDIVMSKNREMDRQKEAHAALASKYNQLREDHHKLIGENLKGCVSLKNGSGILNKKAKIFRSN